MASYTEGILKTAKTDTEWAHISGTSIGVVAKKYWSRLSELQLVVKHTMQEVSEMSDIVYIVDLEYLMKQ